MRNFQPTHSAQNKWLTKESIFQISYKMIIKTSSVIAKNQIESFAVLNKFYLDSPQWHVIWKYTSPYHWKVSKQNFDNILRRQSKHTIWQTSFKSRKTWKQVFRPTLAAINDMWYENTHQQIIERYQSRYFWRYDKDKASILFYENDKVSNHINRKWYSIQLRQLKKVGDFYTQNID